MSNLELIIVGRGTRHNLGETEVRFNTTVVSLGRTAYELVRSKVKGDLYVLFAKAKGTGTIYMSFVNYKHPKGYKMLVNDEKHSYSVNYSEKQRRIDGVNAGKKYNLRVNSVSVGGQDWYELVPKETKSLSEALQEATNTVLVK